MSYDMVALSKANNSLYTIGIDAYSTQSFADIEIGGLASLDGSEAVRTDRVRTEFIKTNKANKIYMSSDFLYIIYCYGYDYGYLGVVSSSFSAIASNVIDLSSIAYLSDTNYIRILLKNAGGTAISGGELTTLQLSYYTTINKEPYTLRNFSTIEIGGLVSSTGAEAARDDRARTEYVIRNDINEIDMSSDFEYIIYCYDYNYGFISLIDSSFSEIVNNVIDLSKITFPSTTKYIRILVANATNTDITNNELTEMQTSKYTKSLKSAINEAVTGVASTNLTVETNKNKITDGLSISSKNMVARLGYNVYDASTPPEHSLASYALAYKNGYRTFLCDLQITSDGYYVCEHDTDFNASPHIRNSDGSPVAISVSVADLTLAALDSDYDFGITKGAEYAGANITRLEDVMKMCSVLCVSLVIETKVKCSQAQIEAVAKMAIKYGLQNQLIWAFDITYDNATDAGYLLAVLPTATVWWRRINATASTATTAISYATSVRSSYPTAQQSVTVIEAGLVNLSGSVLSQLIDLNVDLNYSEVTSSAALTTLINDGYYWLFKSLATRVDLNNYMLDYYGII